MESNNDLASSTFIAALETNGVISPAVYSSNPTNNNDYIATFNAGGDYATGNDGSSIAAAEAPHNRSDSLYQDD